MPLKDLLTYAVYIQDHQTAERLLNEGQCPDGLQNGYQPLLHIAVENDDLQMVRLLLGHGADVNKQDSMHRTALFQGAAIDVDVEISEVLLESGALISTRDMYERTPLHYVSFFPQGDKLGLFLTTANSEELDAVDYFGNTALHLCTQPYQRAKPGCLSVMNLLLTAGANPNIPDNKGRCALHHVSTQYKPDTKLFLSKAQNVNYLLLDQEGNNFMHNLIANQTLEQSYLIDILESQLISKSIWKTLLNGTNMCGLSPFGMYFDTFICTKDIVCKMIELGADVNLANRLGVTPLMKAATFSLDVATALLKHGADPNAQDIYGRNAIHLGMNSAIVVLLIEAGADINLCDKWGCSPLQQSIHSDQDLFADVDVQTTLAKHGSDINHQDMFGATALHHSAYECSEITLSLLKMGANKRITDKSGRTPIEVARLLGGPEIEDLLKSKQGSSSNEKELLINSDDITAENLQRVLHNFDLTRNVDREVSNLLRLSDEDVLNDVHIANQNIKSGVIDLMEEIAQKIGEYDEKFSVQMYASGSSSEGTKVGFFDEFDFVFSLPFFADLCDVVEMNLDIFTGLARLRCKDQVPPREVGHVFDDDGFLLSSELRKECNSLIKRVIRSKGIWERDNIMMGGLDLSFDRNDTEKPVINFSIKWIDKVHRNLEISIDVAFGIRKDGWWPNGIDVEAIPLISEPVQAAGCLLLLQVPEHLQWEGQHFRISSSLNESLVMKNLPQNIKDSYILAKILKNKLCPEIDFGDDEDGSLSIPVSADNMISSYMLKNCLFHVIAKSLNQSFSETSGNIRTRKSIINGTIEIYRCLYRAAKNRILPCYFLPGVDLFTYKSVNLEGYEQDSDDLVLDIAKNTNEILSYCKVILGCLGIFDC
ncbi:ankyrin-3-like [Argopecten irradians]|uniref:ankyrin-3-like n=1 Tax=Argopecten irradians TaxID=31199 RepID=UPI00371DCE6B